MRRVATDPRPNWKQTVVDQGLMWYDGLPEQGEVPARYWDESAFYELTAKEVDQLEAATNELHQMFIRAAGWVIDNKQYAPFHIPAVAIPLIERSWIEEPPSLYGRFDMALAGDGHFKVLEYNADTPTSLLEAAVIQWTWFEQTRQGSDQFNSIHERLVDTWKYFSDWILDKRVSFTNVDGVEDGFTVAYIQETANQAGYVTQQFPMQELGWDSRRREFVDPANEPVKHLFKLYPWEWLAREPFAEHLPESKMVWIEPAWKMLMSNKAILPVVWELHKGHPNLLEATLEQPANEAGWVRKPILGREGNNVSVGRYSTGGPYGTEGFVYQRDARIQVMDGRYAVVGSWIVGQQASGVGIRESATPITDNLSRFVPHVLA